MSASAYTIHAYKSAINTMPVMQACHRIKFHEYHVSIIASIVLRQFLGDPPRAAVAGCGPIGGQSEIKGT